MAGRVQAAAEPQGSRQEGRSGACCPCLDQGPQGYRSDGAFVLSLDIKPLRQGKVKEKANY